MRYRNAPDTARADQAGVVVQAELSFCTWPFERPDAEVEQHRQHEHDAGVPEGEEEPDADSGRLPSAISLRVVLSMAEMWSASKAWRMPRV